MGEWDGRRREERRGNKTEIETSLEAVNERMYTLYIYHKQKKTTAVDETPRKSKTEKEHHR